MCIRDSVEDEQEQDRAERVALGGHGDGDAGGDHADGRQEDSVADAGQRAHEGCLDVEMCIRDSA